MSHLETLNAVKDLLINFANQEGIDLQAEFGTQEKFKEFVIALTFKTLRDAGVATDKAFDAVLGQGSYDELFESVWAGYGLE